MPVQPSAERPPESEIMLRRFLNRAEAVTLLGMILVVASLFLVWKRINLDLQNQPVPALFVNWSKDHTGLSLPAIFWPLLMGASLSSLVLLWTPNEQTRLPFFVMQLAFGLTCFVVSLTHFAILPGVLVALVGSTLLLFGAVDRYMHSVPPKRTD